MTGRWWAAARVAGGLAVLGVLAAQLGTGPFVAGLRAVGPGSAAARAGAGGRDHPVQRPALAARGALVRCRRDAPRGDGGVLPVAVPQLRAARWRAGRRPPRADAPVDPLSGVGAGPGAGRGRRARPAGRAGRLACRVRTVHDRPRRPGGRWDRGGRRSRRRPGQPRGARARARTGRPGALGAGGGRSRSGLRRRGARGRRRRRHHDARAHRPGGAGRRRGPAQRRGLGASRGSRRVGVRRGRPRCRRGRVRGRRVRRPGARWRRCPAPSCSPYAVRSRSARRHARRSRW